MASPKIIVFGPTGAVGSVTALTAEKYGATVILAMRDPTKSIPGLDAKHEKEGKFQRVYADLSLPVTVLEAASNTKAKYAFLYLTHGSSDHMKSTIKALKSAGIEFVVFLSSFTIQGELEAIPNSDVIPYIHAQVEINLREIFGPNGFVPARPGYFASNTLQYKAGLEKGKVRLYMPDAKVDCIVPEDIGRVCGTVLAKGPQDKQEPIYLYGPRLSSQASVINSIAKALAKDVEIEIVEKQDAEKFLIEDVGLPVPVSKYMVRQLGSSVGDNQVLGTMIPVEDLSNVQKYSGSIATTFEEWAEQNKHKFLI